MDYIRMTVPELRDLLVIRKLPTTKGLKQDYIDRLETDDHRKAQAQAHFCTFSHRGRENAEVQEQPPQTRRPVHGASSELRRSIRENPTNDETGQRHSFHDHLHNSPTSTQTPDTSFRDLSEAELEALCRDNYVPYLEDFSGIQARANINAEHDIKYQASIDKRNDEYERAKKIKARAEKKFDTDVAKARLDREDKIKELNADVDVRYRKQKILRPAFAQLKELKELKGISIRMNDFAPHNINRNRELGREQFPIRERQFSPRSSTVASTYRAISSRTTKHKTSDTTFDSPSGGKRARHPSPFEDIPRALNSEGAAELRHLCRADDRSLII